MGKKGKSKGDKKKTVSGGGRFRAKARTQVRRLTMKIARWKRYQQQGVKASRTAFTNAKSIPTKSRLTWDTSGLEKQLKLYQKIATS